jgi:integrase
MGWLKARVGRDGEISYTAMYRDLRGRERSAGTYPSRRRAEREWQRAESRMDAGQVGDPKRGRQSLRHYVEVEWLPHHVMEATTRERYVYLINRHILPGLGGYRMIDLLPGHVREWVTALKDTGGVKAPTIKQAKAVLDAILTTALNDQVTFLHAGKGVKTPAVARRPLTIIDAAQFDTLLQALPDEAMRLLVETGIESGLRWGELTELRSRDLDLATGILTVSRTVVHLKAAGADGNRFAVKDYPKDKQWRRLKLADHLVANLKHHITANGVDADDLLFSMPDLHQPRRYTRPATLPDPATLGLTDPNPAGRCYSHGTPTGYGAGRCRCQHCRNAVAAYRAHRRATGRDHPRPPRLVDTDGHISNDWFRANIWNKALAKAGLPVRVTPHGLRHAHASWLLAGGADLQIVKERLGHASITLQAAGADAGRAGPAWHTKPAPRAPLRGRQDHQTRRLPGTTRPDEAHHGLRTKLRRSQLCARCATHVAEDRPGKGFALNR